MTEVSKINRFVGYFIDAIIASIPMYIFTAIAVAADLPILTVVGYVIYFALFLLRDSLFGVQSIGKKVMKYKVVREDGSSIAGDHKASLIRNISLLIPFVDQIFVLIDKPRLGDGWANTKVVNA